MTLPEKPVVEIGLMCEGDIAEVLKLWQDSDGVTCNSSDDSPESVSRFLKRNEGFCLVARDNGRVVGVVLCGCDGRRAYIYHMAVAKSHRRMGIARRMMDELFEKLKTEKVRISHLFVLEKNVSAQKFWRQCGYEKPDNYFAMTALLYKNWN